MILIIIGIVLLWFLLGFAALLICAVVDYNQYFCDSVEEYFMYHWSNPSAAILLIGGAISVIAVLIYGLSHGVRPLIACCLKIITKKRGKNNVK